MLHYFHERVNIGYMKIIIILLLLPIIISLLVIVFGVIVQAIAYISGK